MGKDFTDGPRGEADRGTDDDGNTYHRPQDNRNITGSKASATASRLRKRKVGSMSPESGDAAGASARMAERGVAHERHPEHRDGFFPEPEAA